MSHDGAPGSQSSERQRRGLDPRVTVGAGAELRGIDHDSLRIGALVGHAEDPEVRSGRVLVVAPVERWIDHDFVADLDVLDARSHCRDDAGPVGSEHGRKGHVPAPPDPPVTSVDGCRDEIHARLSRAGLRIGKLDRDQAFGAAEALQLDG